MPKTQPQNIALARRLRKDANAPEKIAWNTLRQLRRQDYPVRRQHPIGPYIVDFAIVKARLVIEIDGGIHDLDVVKERDEQRQKEIEDMGWDVLRADAETALSPGHLLQLVSDKLDIE
jgi:very-short-patch-repair endonuclease